MSNHLDPVELAQALIAAPSISPAMGSVFDVLEAVLTPLGFTVERFIDGIEPDGPVENLLAVRAGKGPVHFGFAGHLDVVPPGVGWTSDAFVPEVRGDLLYGRGAVDMKGAIAAMIAAVERIPAEAGTLSLILTGDEDDHCLQTAIYLKKTIPAAGLAVLPKTGHTLNLEEPELFNTLLAEFLAQVEAGAWARRDPRADPGQVMRTK